jgi:hypothetical protein
MRLLRKEDARSPEMRYMQVRWVLRQRVSNYALENGTQRYCKALDKWKAAMKDIETQTDANFATSLSMKM